jgi:phosphoribosyl 1,2-cyclic phosphodiesterase
MPAVQGVRFLVLATGSKGNCAYLGTAHSQVLIDCGIGPRTIFTRLRAHGIDPTQIDALLVTHTHSDHIRGLARVAAHLPLRIYCPEAHAPGIRTILTNEGQSAEVVGFDPVAGFYHRDIDVLPVKVSHDCSPTVMFKFYAAGRRLGILTDLGVADAGHGELFGDCDLLLLESNHCADMLRLGPYHPRLKVRIASPLGHLSNLQSAQFAEGLASLPPRLLLGHLSDTNNLPEVVSETFDAAGRAIPHTVIPQGSCGPLVELA